MAPSYDELVSEDLVGAGWEHFTRSERDVASWLRANGAEVRSVEARAAPRLRGPDGVVADGATVEFKTLRAVGVGAVTRNLRIGRGQASRVIIDGRIADLDEATAVRGLKDAVRRYGRDLDEIVLLLGDGRALHWP